MVNQHVSTMPHTSAGARGSKTGARGCADDGTAGGWRRRWVGVPGRRALREDYSALHQPVSMLSLGPGGWVQIANFVVSGLLMVACAVGLRRALRSGRGRTLGPLLIGVYGFGVVGAGMFSADPSLRLPTWRRSRSSSILQCARDVARGRRVRRVRPADGSVFRLCAPFRRAGRSPRLGNLLVPHRAGNARLHSRGLQRLVERHCG
jgi:hypothetical protein